MTKKYSIDVTDNIDPLHLQIIREDLEGHHAADSPPMDWLPLAVMMRNENQEIIAGVIGGSYWGWLYISRVWVKDREQRKIHSLRLLIEAEKEAERRGCTRAYIETQDYESVLFYEEQGYTISRKIEEVGFTRYSLHKEIHEKRARRKSSHE
jgi:GNAT superfamily N-acetyltransferase